MKINNLRDNKFVIVDGNFLSPTKWGEMLYENDGYVDSSGSVTLKSSDLEITVDFDISLVGEVYNDQGDYDHPPEIGADIISVDIIVEGVHLSDTNEYIELDDLDIDFIQETLSDLLQSQIQ